MASTDVAPAPVNQNGDMSHRSGQMGGAGHGGKAAQNLHQLPGKAVGLLNTLTMPVFERTVQAGFEQISKTVAETGTRVTGNVLTKLLKLVLPRL